jgi:hypothetical protein
MRLIGGKKGPHPRISIVHTLAPSYLFLISYSPLVYDASSPSSKKQSNNWTFTNTYRGTLLNNTVGIRHLNLNTRYLKFDFDYDIIMVVPPIHAFL